MRLSVLLTLLPVVLGAPTVKRDEPAPLIAAKDTSKVIPGKYIVKLKDDSFSVSSEGEMGVFSQSADIVFDNVMKGFAGSLDEQALENLRNHPDVDYIEEDAIVELDAYVNQPGATWGLARLSSRSPGSSTYTYDDSAGAGTCSYILDTGVDDRHSDFGGRAAQIRSFIPGENTDGHGHGTHCAGTVGSTTYGVAKKTSIYGVKVLSNQGSGSTSGIVGGMDFVASDSSSRSCPRGVVVNMSLGGGYSAALNNAARNMVSRGIFLAVAAGNDNRDAANYSPASEATACTVGATTSSDGRASFSNYGRVVDIFAPGQSITSLRPGGGTAQMSGTSMAAPHICGLAAYLAAFEGPKDPQSMCSRIQQLAHRGILTGIPAGTQNLLAFNGNPSA